MLVVISQEPILANISSVINILHIIHNRVFSKWEVLPLELEVSKFYGVKYRVFLLFENGFTLMF